MSASGYRVGKKSVHVEPPSHFGPGHAPKFLLTGGVGGTTPRGAPKAVVAAAAAVLGPPRPWAEPCAPPVGLPLRREAPMDARDAPWPPRLGGARLAPGREDLLRFAEHQVAAVETLAVGEDAATPASLGNSRGDLLRSKGEFATVRALAASVEPPGAALRFGDSLCLHFGGREPAVLASAPRGASTQAEARLAQDLAASGRRPEGFAAITALTLKGGRADAVSRRCVWQVYRAEPLDGLRRDEVVRYGQMVRFGQRPSFEGGEELLLSCEPPSRGGGTGAPYLVLGRYTSAPHPDPREEQKVLDTVFRLLPRDSSGIAEQLLGKPVDTRRRTMLYPCSPVALVHGPRALQPVLSHIGMSVSLATAGGSREWLVEGGGLDAPGALVLIERLELDPGALADCDRHREQAHTGLPRALLGRTLEAPPVESWDARGQPAALFGAETSFSRWECLRRAISLKIAPRGPLAFAVFRKVIGHNRPVSIQFEELGEAADLPKADEAPKEDEQCWVPLRCVLDTLSLDYELPLRQEDRELLQHAFVQNDGGVDPMGRCQVMDTDYFCDCVRGQTSPFRGRCLGRLYSQLQQEAGLEPTTCLSMRWLQERLRRQLPEEQPGQPLRTHTPEELLASLPLLRTHEALNRVGFVRWMADITFHLPSHTEFAARVRELWGRCPALSDAREEAAWALLEDCRWQAFVEGSIAHKLPLF